MSKANMFRNKFNEIKRDIEKTEEGFSNLGQEMKDFEMLLDSDTLYNHINNND